MRRFGTQGPVHPQKNYDEFSEYLTPTGPNEV